MPLYQINQQTTLLAYHHPPISLQMLLEFLFSRRTITTPLVTIISHHLEHRNHNNNNSNNQSPLLVFRHPLWPAATIRFTIADSYRPEWDQSIRWKIVFTRKKSCSRLKSWPPSMLTHSIWPPFQPGHRPGNCAHKNSRCILRVTFHYFVYIL